MQIRIMNWSWMFEEIVLYDSADDYCDQGAKYHLESFNVDFAVVKRPAPHSHGDDDATLQKVGYRNAGHNHIERKAPVDELIEEQCYACIDLRDIRHKFSFRVACNFAFLY